MQRVAGRFITGVSEHEERCQNVHGGAQFLPVARAHLHQDIRNVGQHDTVADAVCERHEGDTYEARDGIAEVVELDVVYACHHDGTHQHQCGSRGLSRDGQEQRGQEQGQQEADGGGECSQSAASSSVYARSTLHIGGHRAGAQHGAYGGADGVSHECLLQARDVPLLVHHAGTARDTDEGAYRVEHVNEEEGEDTDDHVEREDIRPLELQQDGRHAGWGVHHAVQRRDAQGNADDGGDDDTNEQCTRDIAHHQHGREDDAEACQQHAGRVQVAQGYEGGVVAHHDAGRLQAYQGDEQTDTRRDGLAKHERHGIHNLLTQAGEREQHEDEALKEHGGQCELPRVPHREHDGEGKECIQSHARSQCKGQFGIESHDQCGHHRCDDSRREDGALVHACSRENRGIDGQDIGHRQEGGDTRNDLLPDAHSGGVESEEFLYHVFLVYLMYLHSVSYNTFQGSKPGACVPRPVP